MEWVYSSLVPASRSLALCSILLPYFFHSLRPNAKWCQSMNNMIHFKFNNMFGLPVAYSIHFLSEYFFGGKLEDTKCPKSIGTWEHTQLVYTSVLIHRIDLARDDLIILSCKQPEKKKQFLLCRGKSIIYRPYDLQNAKVDPTDHRLSKAQN